MSNTSNYKLLKCILSLLIFSCSIALMGQPNIKVGYTFGYAKHDQAKAIFDRFNLLNPQAEQKLTPAKYYNGLDLGLRYRFKYLGIELSVSSIGGTATALNVFQENGSLGQVDWRMSLINYALGIENYFGNVGYGASIGTQKLKYKTDFIGGGGRKTIYSETVLNSKFYLIFDLPSNSIAFSLRPYISTTWQPYNIRDVELAFDPQSTLPQSDFDQDLIVYGISFLFYNGPQRN